MSFFIRPRRAHRRLASGVIIHELFEPAKLAGCFIDPQAIIPDLISHVVECHNNINVNLTGSVAETILGTINFPLPRTFGPTSYFRLRTWWSCTNNANAKLCRIRFSGLGGTDYTLGAFTLANQGSGQLNLHLFGVDAQNQFGKTDGIQGNTLAVISTNTGSLVDTTQPNLSVVITGQLANGADSLALNGYAGELFR